MSGGRSRAFVVVMMVLATAGCGIGTRGQRSGPPPSVVGPSAGPRIQAPGWRVVEAVPLAPTSILKSVVAIDATHAWAVGGERYSPEQSDSSGVPVIERWDGRTWSRETLPDQLPPGFLDMVAADSPTNVWALGARGTSQGDNIHWLLHYDGTAWRQVPFPIPQSSSLTTIGGLAVVGGRTWLVGNQGSKVIIREWDGETWRTHQPPVECEQGGASFGGMPNFCNFSSVKAFAPDDVWVGGNGSWAGFQGPALFHWDGASWQVVDVGANRQLYAISAVDGRSSRELWAVGNLFNSGTPYTIKRDGERWRAIGGLPEGLLPAMAVDSTGQPWVISNYPSPDAKLMRYTEGGEWAGAPAPRPRGTIGITLDAITAVPGTDTMFAVGSVTPPGETVRPQAVILEYSTVGNPLP